MSTFPSAASFYLKHCQVNCMSKLGNKRDRSVGRVILKWFDCMSTQEEREFLMKKDNGLGLKQLDQVRRLSLLVRARLRKVFVDGNKDVPASLQSRAKSNRSKFKLLCPNTIVNRLRQIKSLGLPEPVVSTIDFHKFRKEYDMKDKGPDI